MDLGNTLFFIVSLALLKSRFFKYALLTLCFVGLHICQASRGQTDNKETQFQASAEEWFQPRCLTHCWTGSVRKLGDAKGWQRCEDMGTLAILENSPEYLEQSRTNTVYDPPVPLQCP